MIRSLLLSLVFFAAPLAQAADNFQECKYECMLDGRECREACSEHGRQVLQKCYEMCDKATRECEKDCVNPDRAEDDDWAHGHDD